MLKNHSVHIIATYALLILASPLFFTSDASAAVSCPAGYACMPYRHTQVPNCPAGYVCVPLNSTVISAGTNANSTSNGGYYYGSGGSYYGQVDSGGYTNNALVTTIPNVTPNSTYSSYVPVTPVTPAVSGAPIIDSYSVSPSPVVLGSDVTFSGAARQGSSCIVKHRAIVTGSQTPLWDTTERWTLVGCVSSVSLSNAVSTAQNQYSFNRGPGTYEVRWEVQDSAGRKTYRNYMVVVTPIGVVSSASGANTSMCPLNAVANRGKNGTAFTCSCQSFGAFGVWGTNRYTDTSSICTAAKHAGWAIPGNVVYTIQPGQAAYTGSFRNGIVSSSYASWLGTFVIEPI